MTQQEYIFSVRIAGLSQLGQLGSAIKTLNTQYNSLANSSVLLAQAMNHTQFAFKGNETVMSSGIIRSMKVVDLNTKELTTDMLRMTAIVKQATGEYVKYNYALEKAKGATIWELSQRAGSTPFASPVRGAELAQLQDAQKPKGFLSNVFGEDIDVGGLVKRAMITIPVWTAMRGALQSLSSVIPTAIDRFKELDAASAKMKILTDGADKIDDFRTRAMSSLNALSRETGIAVADLQAIYTAVSSTGIDAETSFMAMTTIAKGALATGADSKELATTMAGLINTMGDSLNTSATKGEKFQMLMALLHSAMKTNAGSMNDFSAALSQAGSSASTSGMSLVELIANVAVLQTAMVRAGMGGTALRTSLDQVVQKRQKVSDLLRGITTEQDKNQFTLVLAVVDKIKNLAEGGKLNEANKYMEEIFGVKAAKNINVLRNNLEKFNYSIGDLNKLMEIYKTQGIDAMMTKMVADYQVALSTLEQQQKKFGVVIAELASSLVSGFFGRTGDKWTKTLADFINWLDKLIPAVNEAGRAVTTFLAGFALYTGINLGIKLFANFAGGIYSVRDAFVALQLASEVAWASMLTMLKNPYFLAFLATAGTATALVMNASKLKTQRANTTADVLAQASTGKDFIDIQKDIIAKAKKDVNIQNLFGRSIKDNSLFYKDIEEAFRAGQQVYLKQKLASVLATIDEKKKQATASTPSNTIPTKDISTPDTYKDIFDKRLVQLETMKRYGLDEIQLLKQEIVYAQDRYTGEELITKNKEYQLQLQKLLNAEQQKYADSLQASIKDSLLGNLQGKGNNLLSDMGKNFTSQLQNSLAENMSKIVMSTGIGDIFSGPMSFLDEGTRKITDPIIQAHTTGGQAVHDFIIKAFDKVTGKSTDLGNMGPASVAGWQGTGGNNLPGIWGTPFFTQKYTGTNFAKNVSQQSAGPSNYDNLAFTGKASNQSNFWGKLGAGTMALTSGIMTGAEGVQQIKGGGAKNITSGVGQVGMALGSTALATGMLAGTGTIMGLGAANFWNPVGWGLMIIGAVLMIASMFMKSAKQSQTTVQTSETKVGSKIDVSNKKLELINRNLLALRNTMETFALSSSAYLSEKTGTIDGNFALAGKRSYS